MPIIMILCLSVIGLGRIMWPKPSLWDVTNRNDFWRGSLTGKTNYLQKVGPLPLHRMQGTAAALIVVSESGLLEPGCPC